MGVEPHALPLALLHPARASCGWGPRLPSCMGTRHNSPCPIQTPPSPVRVYRRDGPFEENDIFAIMNAVPAMALIIYGFLTPNITGGICYGAGLGITLFGIAYMFVHDGLVHR